MGRVLTNNVGLEYSVEASIGVLAGTPTWKSLEPNAIKTLGSSITKVAREPISPERQRRKGTTVDLDSAAEFEGDLTKEHFKDFIEGFVFSRAKYPDSQSPLQSGALFQTLAADDDPPPGGTDSGYTHSAITTPIVAGRLLFARGFTNATNNGLKIAISGSTTTATLISTVLVDETPTNLANATLELAGVRAAVSDLTLTVTGVTAVLGSTALNFTTLGLNVGQFIHVGGLTATNQFSTCHGFARITSIAATALGLDKFNGALLTNAGTGKVIDLLYGNFIRNVATSHADYLERSYQFELALPNLAQPGPGDEYEYSKGNMANKLALQLPLVQKATCSFGFIGTDTEVPVGSGSRKTNASTPVRPVQTVAINTTNDTARLRVTKVDESGLTTCFKNMTLTLDNQVSPEKCLGTLGATFMNTGNFLVDIETQILLTHSAVISSIRNNDTVTMDFILRNDDGAIAIDIPAMTIGGGDKEFPINESVLVNLTGQAFGHPTLGYSLGVSTFPTVPSS